MGCCLQKHRIEGVQVDALFSGHTDLYLIPRKKIPIKPSVCSSCSKRIPLFLWEEVVVTTLSLQAPGPHPLSIMLST